MLLSSLFLLWRFDPFILCSHPSNRSCPESLCKRESRVQIIFSFSVHSLWFVCHPMQFKSKPQTFLGSLLSPWRFDGTMHSKDGVNLPTRPSWFIHTGTHRAVIEWRSHKQYVCCTQTHTQTHAKTHTYKNTHTRANTRTCRNCTHVLTHRYNNKQFCCSKEQQMRL